MTAPPRSSEARPVTVSPVVDLRRWIAPVAAVALLAACSGDPAAAPRPTTTARLSMSPSPEDPASDGPPASSEALRFRAGDGTRLAGRIFGAGDVGVVLAHQIDNDQTAWFEVASELAAHGFAVLTFDFRGYCPGGIGGCSEPGALADTWMDVLGAARVLRERGATRVWLVGASVGGDACLQAASTGPPDLAGVITLSSPKFLGAYDIRPATMEPIAVPKLFIAGRRDGDAPSSARRFYAWSSEPKAILLVPTGEHGTDLFRFADEAIQARVRDAILDQLDA